MERTFTSSSRVNGGLSTLECILAMSMTAPYQKSDKSTRKLLYLAPTLALSALAQNL